MRGTLGLDVSMLGREKTEKGEYLSGVKKTGGVPTVDVLAALCPAIIGALPFAKRMHWGNGDFAFARPVRWILALFDSDIVSFEVGACIQVGKRTDIASWGLVRSLSRRRRTMRR